MVKPSGPSPDDLKAIEDAQRFGMDAESVANLVEALRGPDQPDDIDGVWPVNVETVLAFVSVSTQWRVASRGGAGFSSGFGGAFAPIVPVWIGLDYVAAKTALEIEGIPISAELWRGLRIMEDEACAALNKAD